MNKHHATPAFAVGDIYLAELPELRECEIEDIAPSSVAIKIKGSGWLDVGSFQLAIKARLGRAVYSPGVIGRTRRFIREA